MKSVPWSYLSSLEKRMVHGRQRAGRTCTRTAGGTEPATSGTRVVPSHTSTKWDTAVQAVLTTERVEIAETMPSTERMYLFTE